MMKCRGVLLIFSIFILIGCNAEQNENVPSKTDQPANSARVDSILNSLSLEDKVGEMTQLTLDMICVGEPYNLVEPHQLDPEKLHNVIVDLKVGSILNCGGHGYPIDKWREIIIAIQKLATNEKSSKIPVLYGIDAIHGANYVNDATLFPQQIGQAATWNPEMVKKAAEVTAYETSMAGIPWNFSPVLDIGRDPRWPRFWETYGEDVKLASDLGVAAVKGYQNDSEDEYVSACLKHFLGYSMPLTGHDRSQAWVPERQLREYFLPTFERAMEAGAMSIMINSGEMNGIPVHVDKKILTDLLRDELGFEGVAVTDWSDINYLYTRHMVAEDYKEAIKMSINAGVDMAMVPIDLEFTALLIELVEEGEVKMSRIDEAVGRILTMKEKLGLFEDPLQFPEKQEFASAESARLSLSIAEQSITMLKNNNQTLPLQRGMKVLVTGPNADDLNALNGGWSHTWQGNNPDLNTPGKLSLLEALQNLQGNKIDYQPYNEKDPARLNVISKMAGGYDAVIVCIGEKPYTENVGDIGDLELDLWQQELVERVSGTCDKVIGILIEGRPRTFAKVEGEMDAILMAYLPGDEGGRAIANLLYGETNPSGKLPFTYPREASTHHCYDHKRTDELNVDFSFTAFNPLFEFGHGLSYTSFSYSNLEVSADSIQLGSTFSFSFDVENTGNRTGDEVAIAFIQDKVASITPPVKRMRAYKRLTLNPGEKERLTFELHTDDLGFVGIDNEWITEVGDFEISVGGEKTQMTIK